MQVIVSIIILIIIMIIIIMIIRGGGCIGSSGSIQNVCKDTYTLHSMCRTMCQNTPTIREVFPGLPFSKPRHSRTEFVTTTNQELGVLGTR